MASVTMETILEASAVTAAAAGRLSVDPKDAESVCGWLAVARIALLEIWVETGAMSDTGQTLEVANQTKIDGRILALAAIPKGQCMRYFAIRTRRSSCVLCHVARLLVDSMLIIVERRAVVAPYSVLCSAVIVVVYSRIL